MQNDNKEVNENKTICRKMTTYRIGLHSLFFNNHLWIETILQFITVIY